MQRFFTLEQAQNALPGVESLIRQAIALKADYDSADAELRNIMHAITIAGGSQVDRESVLNLRTRRDSSLQLLKDTLERIQESGCLVKDLDTGLLDFPTLYRGTEVYLCWKLGEDRIRYWHAVADGFRGRKPIDEDFLANHTGDRVA